MTKDEIRFFRAAFRNLPKRKTERTIWLLFKGTIKSEEK